MSFQGQIIRNQPSYRPRPANLASFHAFTADGFVAYVPRTLLESMVAEAKQTSPNETYGFVFGRPFRDQLGLYTLVSAAPVAKRAKRQPSFVQTSLADETAATALLDHEHMTAEKLGWWHSHPMGISNYSMTDQENQRLACPRDYQLGLLVCLKGNHAFVHAFWGPESIRCSPPFQSAKANVLGLKPSGQKDNGHIPTFGPAKQPEAKVVSPPNNGSKQRLYLISAIIVMAMILGIRWLTPSDRKTTAENAKTTEPTNAATDDLRHDVNQLALRVKLLEDRLATKPRYQPTTERNTPPESQPEKSTKPPPQERGEADPEPISPTKK